MISNILGGRLPPSEWYPANERDITTRRIALRTGEVARVVESGATGDAPVLLVHGWGCSAYYYRKLVPSLASLGRRVIALDLRGHGGSDKPLAPGLYVADAMADFVEAAVEALSLDRPAVVAHSLGGGVMLDVAARGNVSLASLTLLAPVGLGALRFVSMARLATPLAAAPLVPYAAPRWSIPLVLRRMYGTLGLYTSRDVDEYWAPTQDPAFAQALRALLHEFRFAPRTDDELRRVRVPVCVMLGGRDLLVRCRSSAQRVSVFPRARLRIVERAGHVLAEEVPEQVMDELRQMLAADS